MTDSLGRTGYARQTAYEYVRETLRQAILSGEIARGSRLVQADLAEALEVSTTPVREALRDLASEGLVRFDTHRGAVVPELSRTEMHEIYGIRRMLEPVAVRQAVRGVTPALIGDLEVLHAKMQEEPASTQWVDFNRSFHMSVYEMASSPRLTSIISGLQDASLMYIGTSVSESPKIRHDANIGHGAILDALRDRDTEAAVIAVLDHLESSMSAFDPVGEITDLEDLVATHPG